MNFLVIRFSSLGDIIQTTAFLRVLKELYPNGTVFYVTKEEFSDLLKGQPYINELLLLRKGETVFDIVKKIEKVDCIFDLHVNLRSIVLSFLLRPRCVKRVKKNVLYRRALVMHNEFLKKIFERESIDNIEEQIKLITEDVRFKKTKPSIHVANNKKKSNVVGMAIGARWKTKMWPKEYFKKLAFMLADEGFEIYLFGSKEERDVADFVKADNDSVHSFVGELTLIETAEKMSECIGFVSNDSGLMHLAVALDLPLVAIFGPTVRGFGFFPRGRSVVVESDVECRPCSLHGTNKCRRGNLECMYSIQPGRVFQELKKVIKNGQTGDTKR